MVRAEAIRPCEEASCLCSEFVFHVDNVFALGATYGEHGLVIGFFLGTVPRGNGCHGMTDFTNVE